MIAVGAGDACQLGKAGPRVGDVVEDEGGDHPVEHRWCERHGGDVGGNGWRSCRPPVIEHRHLGIALHDAGPELAEDRPANPGTRPDIEHEQAVDSDRAAGKEVVGQRPVHEAGVVGPAGRRAGIGPPRPGPSSQSLETFE